MRGMKNYHHLTIHEREKIKLLFTQRKSLRAIAKRLGRDRKTIGRELDRNCGSLGRSAYCPTEAQKQAVKRRAQSKTKKLDRGHLRTYVVGKLNRGWSPETIAGRLKGIHSQTTVSYETIYKFVYAKGNHGMRYWEFLPYAHKRRELFGGRKSQSDKRLVIPNKTNISERPEEANQRLIVGHLESDLMEGAKKTGSAISVTVDRKSGFVMLDKLTTKQSDERIGTLIKRLKRYPAPFRKTVTFDNGKENYNHEQLIEDTGCQTYFCNAYHFWEKGTVENTIKLVRSWIPKRSDLTKITQTDLNIIGWELNNRPRKRLGFRTPVEVILQETNWGTSS